MVVVEDDLQATPHQGRLADPSEDELAGPGRVGVVVWAGLLHRVLVRVREKVAAEVE